MFMIVTFVSVTYSSGCGPQVWQYHWGVAPLLDKWGHLCGLCLSHDLQQCHGHRCWAYTACGLIQVVWVQLHWLGPQSLQEGECRQCLGWQGGWVCPR